MEQQGRGDREELPGLSDLPVQKFSSGATRRSVELPQVHAGVEAGDLFLDYSKTHLNRTTRKLLVRLAKEAYVPAAIDGRQHGGNAAEGDIEVIFRQAADDLLAPRARIDKNPGGDTAAGPRSELWSGATPGRSHRPGRCRSFAMRR